MTATAATTSATTGAATATFGAGGRAVVAHPVRRATVRSGLVAAGATTAVAAAAGAAGVPLEIDGAAIPLLGFAQLTLIGAFLGGLLMAACNRYTGQARRWFLPMSAVLTAASCIPSVTLPPDAATKIVLVATHLIAALIVVPALAGQAD